MKCAFFLRYNHRCEQCSHTPSPLCCPQKNEIKNNPTDETDEMISVVFSKTTFSVTMTLLSEGHSPGRFVFFRTKRHEDILACYHDEDI